MSWFLFLVLSSLFLGFLGFGGVLALLLFLPGSGMPDWHPTGHPLGWALVLLGWSLTSYVGARLMLPTICGGKYDELMLLLRRLTGKRVHKGLGDFPRLQLLRVWATYRICLSLFALVWLLRCVWLGATDHPRVSRDSLALDVFMVRRPLCARLTDP